MKDFRLKVEVLPDDIQRISGYFRGLLAFGTPAYEQVILELARENRPGGSPEIKELQIGDASLSEDLLSGKVRLVYDVEYVFGCEDSSTYKAGQSSDWVFVVNRAQSEIIFKKAFYEEERSTADEF